MLIGGAMGETPQTTQVQAKYFLKSASVYMYVSLFSREKLLNYGKQSKVFRIKKLFKE